MNKEKFLYRADVYKYYDFSELICTKLVIGEDEVKAMNSITFTDTERDAINSIQFEKT